MNEYKQQDVATLVNRLERLNTQLDEVLSALSQEADAAERAALLDALARTLHARGTVLDAFIQWYNSPQGKYASTEGRRKWLDALERLRASDQHRVQQLGQLVATAGEQLRQRIAQQAVFIYQRGTQ